MIQIRPDAEALLVERVDHAAVVVEVRVCACEAAVRIDPAAQSVDAAVVVLRAEAESAVIRPSGHVGQRPEVVVEGAILLHDDDDVIHLVQVAVGARSRGGQAGRQYREADLHRCEERCEELAKLHRWPRHRGMRSPSIILPTGDPAQAARSVNGG